MPFGLLYAWEVEWGRNAIACLQKKMEMSDKIYSSRHIYGLKQLYNVMCLKTIKILFKKHAVFFKNNEIILKGQRSQSESLENL